MPGIEQFEDLVSLGFTPEEAALVDHVARVAERERERALRTGVCRCGGRLVRRGSSVECQACPEVHAA